MNFISRFFKATETGSKKLSREQIVAFEGMSVKQALELKLRDLKLLEPKGTKELPTHLVMSYKGVGIATLYPETFVRNPAKLSKSDQETVNKILGAIKKHYE